MTTKPDILRTHKLRLRTVTPVSIGADEADVKRLLVNRCRQVIAVIDATKWGRVGLASFARVADIDLVISDHDALPDLVAQVRIQGVEVVLV